MLNLLHHRGPDDRGIYADPHARVAIGATRLSIIDIEGGHQPLTNEDETIICVLNGEIYNFKALRRWLESKGHVFRTNTDTEVLVHLYEEYGTELVHAIDGMFAFALWDKREQTLMLARDRLGEKPLFIHQTNDSLAFASELTALREGVKPLELELEPAAVDSYFSFGYVPGPRTIYRHARQLEPATVAEWKVGQLVRYSVYWSSPVHPKELPGDSSGLVEEMVSLVERAVRSQLVADVPVGVFLSGGVDSSLVAAASARFAGPSLETFSVDYDIGTVSETAAATRVAEAIGTRHHAFTLATTDVATLAPRVLGRMDQPLADPAVVALAALASFARERVTVALGGEGADELFGGYPRYRWLSRLPEHHATVSAISAALALLPQTWIPAQRLSGALAAPTILDRHLSWVAGARLRTRDGLLGPMLEEHRLSTAAAVLDGRLEPFGNSKAGYLMRLDQSVWLPDDVLMKADRSTMLASLEFRAPFLSRELVEFAASVPTRYHLARGGKRLIRAALSRFLPVTHTRRRKVAFRVPVAEWLRGPLRARLENQAEHCWIFDDGWFNRETARTLIRAHLLRDDDHSGVLWPLFALGCWSQS